MDNISNLFLAKESVMREKKSHGFLLVPELLCKHEK